MLTRAGRDLLSFSIQTSTSGHAQVYAMKLEGPAVSSSSLQWERAYLAAGMAQRQMPEE